MENLHKGRKVEFHVLQSFPVTCLNRDDVGAPKSAIVGGVNRARVSSQCWKRQVRLAMRDLGMRTATRTKHLEELLKAACVDLGAEEENAQATAETVAKTLAEDTLHFISHKEINALAEYCKSIDFDANRVKAKEVYSTHKKAFDPHLDGLDIALFGRMVAKAAELNVEAAVSFSHALSTHKAVNEVEFFTALDDEKPEDDSDAGSSHMGTMEYNSATYYRYVSIDLGQLVQTLGTDEDLDKALEAFIKALYLAVPSARQTTQAGYSTWDYARVYVRKGQNLQASFEEPVKSRGSGFLKPSIEALNAFLDKKEQLSGSLFGKEAVFSWGEDESFSIDDLLSGIIASVSG